MPQRGERRTDPQAFCRPRRGLTSGLRSHRSLTWGYYLPHHSTTRRKLMTTKRPYVFTLEQFLYLRSLVFFAVTLVFVLASAPLGRIEVTYAKNDKNPTAGSRFTKLDGARIH